MKPTAVLCCAAVIACACAGGGSTPPAGAATCVKTAHTCECRNMAFDVGPADPTSNCDAAPADPIWDCVGGCNVGATNNETVGSSCAKTGAVNFGVGRNAKSCAGLKWRR